MKPRIRDVEQLKKQVRKLAAGNVLAGDSADVGLDLAQVRGCQVRVAAGYGALSASPEAIPHDRFLWILDGHLTVQTPDGRSTDVSQGESTVLAGGAAYRLVCPQLTLYLLVEPKEKS